jgi:prophage regulatory protein
MSDKRFLRLPAVKNKTGLSGSSIYEGMAEGWFPRQIPISKNRVGWLEEEIDQFLDECIAKRDQHAA